MASTAREAIRAPGIRRLTRRTGVDAGLRATALAWAVAFGLVLAPLLAWMDPVAAAGAAAVAATSALAGLLLLRAEALHAPGVLASATLVLVVAGALMALGTIGLALLGAPIGPATVLPLGAAVALGTGLTARRRAARGAALSAGVEPPPVPRALTSTTVVACGVVLAAVVLLVLPGTVHRLALAVYGGGLLWVVWRHRDALADDGEGGRPSGRWAAWLAALPFALLAGVLATRLAPFLRSPVPLGYDTGLYRGVQRDFVAALPSVPAFAADSWADVQPPGLYVLSDLLALLGATPDALLWGLLILTQLVFAAGLWLLAHDVAGRRAANWALALFVLSSAQYTLYYQVYFKQSLSLALLPFTLWLWRRHSWLAVPVGALLAATHTMGFLLLGLVLLTDALWLPRLPRGISEARATLLERRYHLVAGAAILALGLGTYGLAPGAIGAFVSPDLGATLRSFGVGGDVAEGSFRLDPGQYAGLVLPLIPFAAFALVRRWRDPSVRLVVLWAGWAGAFVAFDLIFARRFLASFDPAFILLAASGIAELTRGRVAVPVAPFVAIAVVSGAFLLARTGHELAPLIPADDLRDLQRASAELPPDAYLMAVSSADAPWVRGYGTRDTIAPGMFEHDRWTFEEWRVFWQPATSGDRYALLAMYDRPVYAFLRTDLPMPGIAEDPRFRRISDTLWQYIATDAARPANDGSD